MDSFNFHDMIRVEKANAVSRYRRIQRITTLFRFVELFVFLIIVSRVSVDRFALALKMLSEFSRGISVALISPRFVFLIGNAIVAVLFLKSGGFSASNAEKVTDLYDEYMEKCQMNLEKRAVNGYKSGVCYQDHMKELRRSNSERVERRRELTERLPEVPSRRELRRSMTESGREVKTTDEMSSEEFRRTVEAFIARQQRFLREE